MLDIIIIIAARPLLIDAGEQIMYLKFNQDNKIVSKKKKKNAVKEWRLWKDIFADYTKLDKRTKKFQRVECSRPSGKKGV